MSKRFNLEEFNSSTKMVIIACSIFLMSLSLGMLALGSNLDETTGSLDMEALHHGAEAVAHINPH